MNKAISAQLESDFLIETYLDHQVSVEEQCHAKVISHANA